MNDAWGDPRNYDPNDAGFDPYDYDSTWGPEPTPFQPPIGPTRRTYSWWTDPDNDPPEWMLNGSQHPTVNPGPGNYWNWAGDHWEALSAPRANNPAQSPSPAPPSGGGEYGGGGGFGGFGGFGGSGMSNPNEGFQWPTYQGQRFSFPDFGGFRPFQAPTMESILADPVLQAQLTEGRRAIKGDRAFRGTLNSGDTLKDIFDWTGDRVKLGANDAFDRAFKVYDVNERQNPFNTWNANRGLAMDTFQMNSPIARDEFMFNQYEPAKLRFQDNYNRWAKQGDWLTNLSMPPG